MKFNNNIPDWATGQINKTKMTEAEARFYSKEQPKPAEPVEKDNSAYIKQLARMNPEFKRTITPVEVPDNLMGKSKLMKAHVEGSYDNGKVGSTAIRGRKEFSVYSQFDKLADKNDAKAQSIQDALKLVVRKDNAEAVAISESRAKREIQQKRAMEKIVKTEGFLSSAQARAQETFTVDESAYQEHDFRAERKRIQSQLGRTDKVKDEFKPAIAKPRTNSLVQSLQDKLKKKGLI